MGKEAPQVVCPGAVWALPSSSSLQLWTEAVAPSFYSSPLILSTARLGKGECGGGGSLQRWVLGCMVFALDLFWGVPSHLSLAHKVAFQLK